MSKKSRFKAELQNTAHRCGGATLTVQGRSRTADRLAQILHQNGYPLQSISEIKIKHIESYVRCRQQEINDIRTLHNDISHIRSILSEAGRHKIADHDRLKNERLCGGKAERSPARTAPAKQTADRIISAAFEKDPGVGAGLQLQRELGLRSR